ncbi:MAG TPA: ribosome maturation factor RimP, partial [Pseudothauera hydrothermalis]|nr:ribosome maturation factor RimP [Pseudothauera hydrothermalis]
APVGNQKNFMGVLGGVKDGAVVLSTEKGEFVFAFDQIDKARLVPKF